MSAPCWLKLGAMALLPAGLLVSAFAIDGALYRNKIHRGVRVAGVDLGGLNRARARQKLASLAEAMSHRPLLVKVAGQNFEFKPERVRAQMAVDATLDAAFARGRDGDFGQRVVWWVDRFVHPDKVFPRMHVQPVAMEAVLNEYAHKALPKGAFPGGLKVENHRVVPLYPRAGSHLPRRVASRKLLQALAEGKPQVRLPVVTRPAMLTNDAVDKAASQAAQMLSRQIRMRDGESGTSVVFSPDELQNAFAATFVSNGGPHLRLGFKQKAIEAKFAKVADALEGPMRNARIEIGADSKPTVVPSRAARSLSMVDVVASLNQAARQGHTEAVLPVKRGERPTFTTADAQKLEIRELVSRFETKHPCCQARVKNIHRIAELVNGTLLRPGEVFSINRKVGERTLSKGFFPAPSIYGGEMVDTIGGGISQFATTLYNAALNGGFRIIERAPHSYYFSRYPEGHEATLSFPHPDLVFKNDSKYGLLIKTTATPTRIRVELFGKRDGRMVQRGISERFAEVEAPVKYEINPRRKPGKPKVLKRGRGGWSVWAERTVTFKNGRQRQDRRKVVYRPQERKLELHPCDLPPDHKKYPRTGCEEAMAAAGVAPAKGDGRRNEETASPPKDPKRVAKRAKREPKEKRR